MTLVNYCLIWTLLPVVITLFITSTTPAVPEGTLKFPQLKSTAKAYKGTAKWIIKDFSNFGRIESTKFPHEYLNWSLVIDRLNESIFVKTEDFRHKDVRPVYGRITLDFESCLGAAIGNKTVGVWTCPKRLESNYMNCSSVTIPRIALKSWDLIEKVAMDNNDTMVISAEFSLLDDLRHEHTLVTLSTPVGIAAARVACSGALGMGNSTAT